MSPAKIAPFFGNVWGKLVFSGVTLIAAAAFVGLREPSGGPAPIPQASASKADLPRADTHLASLQSAFAMSHLGALREDAGDEPEVEAKEPAPRTGAEQKARVTPPRSAAAPRANAPVAPLPPVVQQPLPPAPQAQEQGQAQAVTPESKPSSLFGFVPKLPSPDKLVERAASLGDSITSLMRWR